jgi:hypothetical protein
MRLIHSRYPGRCRKCSEPFRKGALIYWAKGEKALCVPCHNASNPSPSSPSTYGPPGYREEPTGIAGSPVETQGAVISTDEFETWMIDWIDLREKALQGLAGQKVCNRQANQKEFLAAVQGSSWKGYDTADVDRWIHSGYQVQGLSLGDPPVPIREKRKLRFSEEGEEFHFDMLASGEDIFYSEYTKREMIPGLAIEANINFQGTVSASITQAYFSWLCRAIYSLEEAGVDCQVTLANKNTNLFHGDTDRNRRRVTVRVKKENEITDFRYWSAMISPAAARTFGFAAKSLYADSVGKNVTNGMGNRAGIDQGKWSVRFNTDRQVLEVDCAWSGGGYSFPEEDMTRQLHEALVETRKGRG